ncbi:MAG: 16S rRNA (guanine(527)-N(7))-methyltransferase RsmG [Prevotella sp.]
MIHLSDNFPNLSATQTKQFAMLYDLYHEWNEKINVISRKDIDNVYEHHVLHSLAIAKLLWFASGSKILDLGTGGGFPGIPLAILFPQCQFKMIDGTAKKIRVVTEVANAIGLKNCMAQHIRGEEEKGLYDFVVSRAVMPLKDLVNLTKKNVSRTQRNTLRNGIICLKGGNLDDELNCVNGPVTKVEIADFFNYEWFEKKYVIYLPIG